MSVYAARLRRSNANAPKPSAVIVAGSGTGVKLMLSTPTQSPKSPGVTITRLTPVKPLSETVDVPVTVVAACATMLPLPSTAIKRLLDKVNTPPKSTLIALIGVEKVIVKDAFPFSLNQPSKPRIRLPLIGLVTPPPTSLPVALTTFIAEFVAHGSGVGGVMDGGEV